MLLHTKFKIAKPCEYLRNITFTQIKRKLRIVKLQIVKIRNLTENYTTEDYAS